MSFKVLYGHRQTLDPYIKRTDLLKIAQEISGKEAMLLCTGKLTTDVLRGLYLSVDDPSHLHLTYAKGLNLIIYARDNNRCWTRMVIFKESMHLFDSPQESTSTGDRFSSLLDEIVIRTPEKPSLEMRSEIHAIWKALSLFVPEAVRAELAQKKANGEMTDLQIAEQLRMPLQYVPHLFGPHYKNVLQILLAGNG